MNSSSELVRQLLEDAEIPLAASFESIIGRQLKDKVLADEFAFDIEFGKIVIAELDTIWEPVAQRLPMSMSFVRRNLQDLYQLTDDGNDGGLLYVFSEEGAFLAYHGGCGTRALPAVLMNLAADLDSLYRVHNGWYEVSGLDGVLPTELFETILDPDTGAVSFIRIAQKGPNCIGFDVELPEPVPCAIWNMDEEVEKIADFWGYIDRWLCASLEDLDVRDTAVAWQNYSQEKR